jgi:16S rRNA C1402 N4-methylase RsmH
MKSLALIAGVLALALSLSTVTAQTTTADPKPAKAVKKKADKPEKKSGAKKAKGARLNHVVAFKFKDDARKEDVRKVEEAFRALKTKIPQVQRLAWGLNNSPEGFNKGCTHVWILTFNSEEDRNVYITHPDHEEFKKLAKPLVADVFVADFWAKD